MRRTLVIASAALLVSLAGAQSFTLSLSAPSPAHFTPTTSVVCPSATIPFVPDLVRTEPLTLTFDSTPSAPFAGVTPRRMLLVLGVASCTGPAVPGTSGAALAYLDPLATPGPIIVLDSFTHPFEPVFAPGIVGQSSFSLTFGANLFGPLFAIPGLPPLTLQAICEDGALGMLPFILSNAVEFQVIDPAVNFAPTVSSVASAGACLPGTPLPAGPETGGNLITITGTNFLAQSNSAVFPPDVIVGGVAATGVTIVNPTTITAIVPARPATCPPFTAAGPVPVRLRNNLALSPTATFVTAPQSYTYCSLRTPVITAINPAHVPADGAPIVITGTDFLRGAIVRFTPTTPPSAPVDVLPPPGAFASVGPCSTVNPTVTTISLQAPPFCFGPVHIEIINVDAQQSAAATLQYDEPLITGITAAGNGCLAGTPTPSGVENGGSVITLTGINFPAQPNCTLPAVTVNGVACSNVVVVNSTTIHATVPPIPPSCPPASNIGSFPVALVTTPPTTGPVLAPQNFEYCLGRGPVITGINPNHVPADGAPVTISGIDFLHGAIVRFTPLSPAAPPIDVLPAPAAFNSVGPCSTSGPSATNVTLVVPPVCSGIVDVFIINRDSQQSNHITLIYDDPQIFTVSGAGNACLPGTQTPSGVETGGTTITLTGVNFPAQPNCMLPSVTVGGVACSNVMVVSSSIITADVPPIMASCPPVTATGPYPVALVTNPPTASPIVAAQPFRYCLGRAPTITGISPPAISPEGATVTLAGTDFLTGALVHFTRTGSQQPLMLTFPALTITNHGPCIPGQPTATQLTIAAPPFCTGTLAVTVENTDLQQSAPFTLNYFELLPTIGSATPVFTINGLAGQLTYPSVIDTGSPLTINGTNFISGSSPLQGGAFGTLPGVAMTRTEILDPVQPGSPVIFTAAGTNAGVQSPTTIGVYASVGDQTGIYRPLLGVKRLRVVNPPCVHTGNATDLPSAEVDVLVQDGAPPALATVQPAVIPPGFVRFDSAFNAEFVGKPVTICGSNFFARQPLTSAGSPLCDCVVTSPPIPPVPQPGPAAVPCSLDSTPCAQRLEQLFPVAPAVSDLIVPAVKFGTLFSPKVTILDTNTLLAEVPPGLTAPALVNVTVFNPDGRASNTFQVTIVPRLTDPSLAVDSVPPVGIGSDFHRLDRCTLQAIAEWLPAASIIGTQAVAFLPNPNPLYDQMLDVQNGVTAFTSGMYDAVFLFNTRRTDGQLRTFDFDEIDIPATIQLSSSVVTPFGTIGAGTKRVIFKATASELLGAGTIYSFYDENFPFVLRSHSDFRLNALVNLGGASLVDVSANVSGSPRLFQFRSEWQRGPAGGGLGAPGGLYADHPLAVPAALGPFATSRALPILPILIPPVNLGATIADLTATCGHMPAERLRELQYGLTDPCPPMPPTGYLASGGRAGVGRSPAGNPAGGGGGGGFATAGLAGQAVGTAVAQGGVVYGSSSSTQPAPGRPTDDLFIYGSNPGDFAAPLGMAGNNFPYALFPGGSGGGGGGGSLAIFVPCVSIGGRGGNGGGSVVLLADRVFTLGDFGRVFCDGEDGQRGIDAFPIANQDPLFVLCSPGSGGGGAGGSVFIAAVADAQFPNTQSPLSRFISAAGGVGGHPTGPVVTPTANGGSGGFGRLRVAINDHNSPGTLGALQTTIEAMFSGGNIVPRFCTTTTTSCVPIGGTATMLPPDYFKYPSP